MPLWQKRVILLKKEKIAPPRFSEETLYIHGTAERELPYRPVSYPIYQTSTFENLRLSGECEYSYSRCSNPTRTALENIVAAAEKGDWCFSFASGLAAITAVFSTLSRGRRVVLSEDIYGGTYRLVNVIFRKFGLECILADFSDIESVKSAVAGSAALVFFETPTNPMCRVFDIRKIAEIAHEGGAKLCVDNTFLTPYFQKPLTLGADIVVHSGTKYLCGHNDTSAGFVITSDVDIAESLEYICKTEGTALSPFDSWLVMRGMKTLELRMKRHEENAKKVAGWLMQNRNVSDVCFCGKPGTCDYEIMKAQARGFGGMISFRLKYTTLLENVLSGGNTIIFAESLGGAETLITHPLTQTHATTPAELRKKLGIDETLVRLSCGIEPAEDIIADLEAALGKNL